MTATITSLVPATAPRLVEPAGVAHQLGWEIASQRAERAGAEVAREFFAKHCVDIDDDTLKAFMHDVTQAIEADPVYDSEVDQARRACAPAVRQWIAQPLTQMVQVTGWLRGEAIWIATDLFILTGDPCGRCQVNPEAYGLGGGVRCVDTTGCGYWYCA